MRFATLNMVVGGCCRISLHLPVQAAKKSRQAVDFKQTRAFGIPRALVVARKFKVNQLTRNRLKGTQMRKNLMAAAVSLALGLAATAQAADVVTINPDGVAGGDPNINVGSLGWNNGNALALPAGGTVVPTPSGLIQIYAQGALSNFNNAQGNTIGLAGLNNTYEWTYVLGFQETATVVGPLNSNFTVAPGGNNFFQIFFDATPDSNNLNGTGFNDGTLILSGSIVSGTGTFTANLPAQNLDQFIANNYDGTNGSLSIASTTGTGSSQFDATVLLASVNTAFFPGLTAGMLLNTNTFTNQPYNQVDPSSCFWNGAALIGGAGQNNTGTAPAQCTNTIGTINGVTGPDVMFQTRATTSFTTTQVPEPGSLALLGLGLLSLVGTFRKRLS
jgi:hypothetical protein